jgi:hypothetical protein
MINEEAEKQAEAPPNSKPPEEDSKEIKAESPDNAGKKPELRHKGKKPAFKKVYPLL